MTAMSNDNFQHDTDKWLMSGGVPWGRFEDFGDVLTGTIVEEPEVRQSRDYDSGEPAFWPDGNPQTELVIVLQTTARDAEIEDDDGKRQFVVNSGAKKAALREAVQKARARGLAVGGTLSVTYTHDAEPKKRGYRGAKQFKAVYTPPAAREVPVPDSGPARPEAVRPPWEDTPLPGAPVPPPPY
jgi:hypothetical protein